MEPGTHTDHVRHGRTSTIVASVRFLTPSPHDYENGSAHGSFDGAPLDTYTHRQGGVIGARVFVFQRLRHRYVLGTFEIRTSIRPHLFRHSVHFTLERKKKKKTPPHRKFGYRFRSSLRVPWARRRENPGMGHEPRPLSHGQSRIGSLLCPPIPVKRFV